jgi:hypothetical protein
VLLSSVVRNVGDGANGVVGSVYHSESGLPDLFDDSWADCLSIASLVTQDEIIPSYFHKQPLQPFTLLCESPQLSFKNP